MRENQLKLIKRCRHFLMKNACFILLICPIIAFGQRKASTVILNNDKQTKISYQITDCEKGTNLPNKYAVFSFENKTSGDIQVSFKYEIYFKGQKIARDPATLRATIKLNSRQKVTGSCSNGTDGLALFLSDTGETDFKIKITEINVI